MNMHIPFPFRDPASVWDLSRLGETPQVRRWPGGFGDDATPILLEGEPWRDRPTWCFAHYGVPDWATPDNPAPGIVLVHGGGGTAYPGWVRMWVRRGYAAICVDNCGALPVPTANNKWLPNPEGGPQGWGRIECVDEPERDQWTYHAVAAAIRSHSFLRSLPNVDSRNIGLTGISWGGFLACILAAADPRFAYAVPVYGCGFNYERPYWIAGHDDSAMMKWGALWDPVVFLPYAHCPMLWVDGTNDFAFALSRVRRSAALAPVPHAFSTHLRMAHGHGGPGEGPREILAFADHFARGGADVVRIGECRLAHGRVEIPFHASGRVIVRAELLWTEDGSEVKWHDRLWQAKAIDAFDPASGVVSVPLPGNAFAWVVNLVTDDGLVFSSPYEDRNILQWYHACVEKALQEKAALRRKMRTRRRALSPEERLRASKDICAKLACDAGISTAANPSNVGGAVAVYLASPDEIDLSDFIRVLLDRGVQVVSPRWNGETYDLARLKGLDEGDLRRGPMNILEPAEAKIVNPQDVSVWIVPGLAFTKSGKRLGYGGGWYDRLLAATARNALKIGVAHEFQMVDDLPSEQHDILLDRVVTATLSICHPTQL